MNTGALDSKLKRIFPMCVAVVALTAPGASLARDITLGGGISIGYEVDDRQYDDDDVVVPADQGQESPPEINNRDERYSRLRLAPLITLTSLSERDEAILRYSPSFWQDFETSDNNLDHDLLASLDRFISRNWQVRLADRYRLSDVISNRYGDPKETDSSSDINTTGTATEDTARLSDADNRRRYWTNDLDVFSEYAYREDSKFTVGYRYGILENVEDEDNTSEDYDRHEVLSDIGHRFNSVWKFSVFGSYVRGLFDETEADISLADEIVEAEMDLNEYRAATILQANFLQYHAQSLLYSYYGADYDAEENDDATIHDITLGWRWDISKDVIFGLGAGPTYTKTEGTEGEWGYNGNMSFSYAFERGYINFTAKRGYEVLNFTGNDENGLREFWQSWLRFNYRLMEQLAADLYTGYRYEDEEIITEITPVATESVAEEEFVTEKETFNRKRFSTGASLGYTFRQLYKFSLSYDYSRQDSEVLDDSFDEHRVVLTLSYETDFFKW